MKVNIPPMEAILTQRVETSLRQEPALAVEVTSIGFIIPADFVIHLSRLKKEGI
jgi:hypothetical protein